MKKQRAKPRREWYKWLLEHEEEVRDLIHELTGRRPRTLFTSYGQVSAMIALVELLRRQREEEIDEPPRDPTECKKVFMVGLDKLWREHQMALSTSPHAGNYAPRAMVRAGLAGEFSQDELTTAMGRLLAEGTIVPDVILGYRRNRHYRRGLARATASP